MNGNVNQALPGSQVHMNLNLVLDSKSYCIYNISKGQRLLSALL